MSSHHLFRSKSAPQPIATLASTTPSSSGTYIQRSASHQDVEKNSAARRNVKQDSTAKLRQGLQPFSLPQGDPFSLSGFFPTSLSAIEGEEEEWEWLREENEVNEGRYQRYRGDDEGPVRGGRSAIFGQETSEAIKGEDKMGVLSLKDVSLFSTSAGDYDYGYYGERLMSPYSSDEAVDEHWLHLAQCARRERFVGSSAVAAGVPYGQVFLAK